MNTIKTLTFAILLGLSAHATANDTHLILDDDVVYCESNINLPQGYEFTEPTLDCEYNEGLTPVYNGSKFGYSDKTGKIVIAATFDGAHGFDEGLALVKKGDKYGYITPDGKFAIKPQFTDAWGFWEGRAKIIQNQKSGFIDKTGKIVIAATFDDANHDHSLTAK